MTTMLLLLVLKLGAIQGIFLGDFDTPNDCQMAAQVAVQALSGSDILKDTDAAGLICVPRPEA